MNLFKFQFIPLTLVIGFNLLTLFIFYTAPIKWASDNLLLFLIFSLLSQGMIILGYNIGFKKSKKMKSQGMVLFTFSKKRLNFIFYFYSLTFLIKYAYLLKYSLFDIKGMFGMLLIGFGDPHLGYLLSVNDSRSATISWGIFFLISIIGQIFFVIGYLKWNNLNRLKKVVFVIFVMIEIFYWMGRGTNFGVINLISTLAFAAIFKLKDIKINSAKVLKFYFLILILGIAGVYVFTYNMNKRANDTILDSQAFNIGLSKVNESDNVFNIIPKSFHQPYLFVVSYLSQGYYHTSLAFDLPYKPTYMLGNNPAVISLAEVLGFDIYKDTYVYRLKDKGVDALINWHSGYLWFASDVTFYGVPLLMLFLGYLFGFSWGLSLNDDFLSKIVFIILANMILYLFANNTYLASVFYSFMFILPLWYFTRVLRIRL